MVKIYPIGVQLAAKRRREPHENKVVEWLISVIRFTVLRGIGAPSLEHCMFLVKPLKPSRRTVPVKLNSLMSQIAFDRSTNKL
jgi:hypothetical protein